MRPLLLNMLTVTGAIDCEPLELEYLAVACRQAGVEPVLYDGLVEERRFSTVLRQEQPDLVAITGYITQENRMHLYASLAKRECPGCTVVLGGVHAQLNYSRLCFPPVDFITRSESMEDFRRFLLALREGDKDVLADINGLCRRGPDGAFLVNPYTPCDIAALPLPDRSFRDAHADGYRYLDFQRVSTLKTAVSCPYGCTFCYGTHLHGGQYAARPLDAVLEELAGLQADTVFIVDSDFLVEPERVRAFLRGLTQRHIQKHYICYARADFIVRYPDLIQALCRAGFAYFLVGLESVSDERLDAYHKATSVSLNQQCVRLLQENGAECVALFMADPAFDRQDFRRLYQWVKAQRLRYVTVQIYTPIPPTPLFQEQQGRLTTRQPEKWDLAHLVVPPEKLSRFRFLLCHRWLVARLYLLGWRRGAYRFVTPRYVARQLVRCWKRRRTAS